ncbi:hypothetical protein SAMN02745945_00315 [Peptoclostridium litorale DSM 5388]|uniref:Putative phosphohydrolase n=1 Tax=Peptoclostridium litorale DSM 5388 TaxID=1121324 RepID=A0A069RI09_PEPLI|nr:metallophosphoesterase [Peptoclostridium litorale]KDR96443.1 putative phosphohydrolase [Peptoclostridium litorale DSM 5388]SIN70529.1 hypothetical protein SAMN02745945_00315 [Peptoclostridium litorale DSM 5388]
MFKKIMAYLMLFIMVVAADIVFDVNFPKLNRVEIESGKIPKGKTLRILQITDMHSSKRTDFILEKLQEEDPDIIALTGDIIDANSNDIAHVYEFVKGLVGSKKPVFYVSGNHEWRNPYNPDFAKNIEGLGVTVLDNGKKVIEIAGFEVNICGIDDFQTGHSDLEPAVSDIDRTSFTLLLSHAPHIVVHKEDMGSDLMICGHTHGGQVRFPVIGGVVAPGQGFFPKYLQGLYEVGKDTTLYIDSGYGTSTLPLRMLNRSQITLIEVKGN